MLSEALSYLDFQNRILATRGFVLENIRSAIRHKDRIAELCAAAERRLTEPTEPVYFGHDTTLVDGELTEILVGSREQVELPDGRTRSVIAAEYSAEPMLVQVAYRSRSHVALPGAWAIVEPTDVVLDKLAVHGIEVRELMRAAPVTASAFRPTAVDRSPRLFQGHNEISLAGDWQRVEQTLPAGTAIIAARQPLARLAAQLLEPMSEDSLSTWNDFEAQTGAGAGGSYPVLHLDRIDGLALSPANRQQPRLPRRPGPDPQVAEDYRRFAGRPVRELSLDRLSNGSVEPIPAADAAPILAVLDTRVGTPLRPEALTEFARLLWLDKNVVPRISVAAVEGGVSVRIVIEHVE